MKLTSSYYSTNFIQNKINPLSIGNARKIIKNFDDIETTPDGKHRTYVFYCDPYVSNQKARLEKNHEYIRYVIPKGRTMQTLTQEKVTLLAQHINSTARDSLNGKTPFDLAEVVLDKKVLAFSGRKKVSPDDVLLKPALLKK